MIFSLFSSVSDSLSLARSFQLRITLLTRRHSIHEPQRRQRLVVEALLRLRQDVSDNVKVREDLADFVGIRPVLHREHRIENRFLQRKIELGLVPP